MKSLELGRCVSLGPEEGRQAWTLLPPSGKILLFLLVPNTRVILGSAMRCGFQMGETLVL